MPALDDSRKLLGIVDVSESGPPRKAVLYSKVPTGFTPSGSPILKPLFRVSFGVLILSFLLSPSMGAAPPEEKPSEDAGPPPVSAPWRTARFDAPVERVRAELMTLLKEDVLAVTFEETEQGGFVTDIVEFDDKKFGVNVSTPPPKLSPKYPYAQLISVTSGRYGLEGRLRLLSAGRARMELRAILETRGMDQKARAMRWIPRVSNGEVERQLFSRLALRLLKPASDGSPRR